MGKWKYGVILDAGSSGTRLHVYRWLNSARARSKADAHALVSLPVVETKKDWTKKIHPGVSTFGEHPKDVGPDHLAQLFEHALEIVPSDELENTPIFLLATAGMRLLPDLQRSTLLHEICSYARAHTTFQLPDCDLHIQVIPGETEGLYGWIAANYLLGGFDTPTDHDHGKGHHTYGFLDMGGASAQIAFAPNATEAEKHAEDLKMLRLRKLNGQPDEYKVFTTTWLGFGMHEARRRYLEALVESVGAGVRELPDPCLPAGLKMTKDSKAILPESDEAKGKEPYLLGTGQFTECLSQTFPLLGKDAPCPDAPCLLNGQHVPAIDFDVNHFVGVSEYWHTTHEIFEMSHKDKAYDFHTYQERVSEFCSQPWDAILDGVKHHQWGKKVDQSTALEVCFKASWIINVLHDGINIPRVGLEDLHGGHNGTKAVLDHAKAKGFLDPFQAVNKIDGVEVSWTLGKMVLYASSQVPPANDSLLAVGFGSNTGSNSVLPADFQFAGGSPVGFADDLGDDDWHEKLFSDSPRRIPGLFLFFVIVAVLLFLLCGRERRTSWYARMRKAGGPLASSPSSILLGGSPSRATKRRFAGSKLFGFKRSNSEPVYERVLESGQAADLFELGDLPDDSTDAGSSHSSSDSVDSAIGIGGSGKGAATHRVGRASGWATPRLAAGFDRSPIATSPPHHGTSYFDAPLKSSSSSSYVAGLASSASSAAISSMLPPASVVANAMERSGLMSRTESRERLAPASKSLASLAGGAFGRSRSGSPTRLRSPLLSPFKENVD